MPRCKSQSRLDKQGQSESLKTDHPLSSLIRPLSGLLGPHSSEIHGKAAKSLNDPFENHSKTSGPPSVPQEIQDAQEIHPDPDPDLDFDLDPFPLPRYYVLTSAGKPVYVSRGSKARTRRRSKNDNCNSADDQGQRQKQKQDQGQSEMDDRNPQRLNSDSASIAESKTVAEAEKTREEDQDRDQDQGYSTSDSEEERSTTRVGVMSALISIFQTESSIPGGGGDKIRQIKTTSTSNSSTPINLTFLHRPPLHLVCVSTSKHTLPYHTTIQHLQTLHSYLISLLTTTQLNNIFKKRHNFDLRRLLGGTDRLLDSICRKLSFEMGNVLGALQPLKMGGNLRDELGNALRFRVRTQQRGGDNRNGQDGFGKPPPQTLLVLLLEKGKLVTILRPKLTSLHPKDMEILMHTAKIATSSSRGRNRKQKRFTPDTEHVVDGGKRRQGEDHDQNEDEDAEVWAPICLPKFEHRGFLHMYVSGLKSRSDQSQIQSSIQDQDREHKTSSSNGTSSVQEGGKGKEESRHSKLRSSSYKPRLQLIFVTADREAFPALSSWKMEIERVSRCSR